MFQADEAYNIGKPQAQESYLRGIKFYEFKFNRALYKYIFLKGKK